MKSFYQKPVPLKFIWKQSDQL